MKGAALSAFILVATGLFGFLSVALPATAYTVAPVFMASVLGVAGVTAWTVIHK